MAIHVSSTTEISAAARVRPWVVAGGALLLLLSTAAIWWAKSQVAGTVYVSALGAPSMPTAALFNTALFGIGLGGLAGASVLRGIRSRVAWLRWSAAGTLVATSFAFIAASVVTCTDGCPIPFTAGSSVQDLVHIVAAATGFIGAATVMVQVATSSVTRAHRVVAWGSGCVTGLAAAAGAALSLLRLNTDLGATLEFVAMTAGVIWLSGFVLSRVFAAASRTPVRVARMSAVPC